MSELRYDEAQHQAFINNLKLHNDNINTFVNSEITLGENELKTLQEFYDLYIDIKDMIQKYSWAMNDIIDVLDSVGQAYVDADNQMANEIK